MLEFLSAGALVVAALSLTGVSSVAAYRLFARRSDRGRTGPERPAPERAGA